MKLFWFLLFGFWNYRNPIFNSHLVENQKTEKLPENGREFLINGTTVILFSLLLVLIFDFCPLVHPVYLWHNPYRLILSLPFRDSITRKHLKRLFLHSFLFRSLFYSIPFSLLPPNSTLLCPTLLYPLAGFALLAFISYFASGRNIVMPLIGSESLSSQTSDPLAL